MQPDFHLNASSLQLRLVTVAESPQLQQLIAHSPSLHQWFDWCHAQFSVLDAERFIAATRLNWIRGDAYGFGIYRQDDDQIMGMVAINEFYPAFNMASIGYWLGDQYQGKGIAKQAVRTLSEFCFQQLELTRLEIVCDLQNQHSQRFIEQCGAKMEAVARNRYVFRGEPCTGVVYSLIPRDLR